MAIQLYVMSGVIIVDSAEAAHVNVPPEIEWYDEEDPALHDLMYWL